jgi:hypothetical protein
MLARPATSPIVEVICQGEPRTMGVAQGHGARKKIRAARRVLARLEAFRLQQPRWMPYRLYRWFAARKACTLLAAPLARDYPAMSERLAGIAEGARIGLNELLLFNALEPLMTSAGDATVCPGACSAVAVRGRRSATGEPMVARNFDYLPLVQPLYLVRDSRPQGGLRSYEFTTAPLAGAVDGMNEAGLCITYNYGYTTDNPACPAAPISMAISEALACCRTVEEAARWIRSRPRWGGALLMLCDATGDVASLELSSTRSHLRRPIGGEDVLFHTNRFTSATMREIQVPDDAVYGAKAPTALRGRRVHVSSEQRELRFRQLLEGADCIGPNELGAIMADHGPQDSTDGFTPCLHGSYWHTTACLQFYPKARRMRVAYDTACQAQFEEIEL